MYMCHELDESFICVLHTNSKTTWVSKESSCIHTHTYDIQISQSSDSRVSEWIHSWWIRTHTHTLTGEFVHIHIHIHIHSPAVKGWSPNEKSNIRDEFVFTHAHINSLHMWQSNLICEKLIINFTLTSECNMRVRTHRRISIQITRLKHQVHVWPMNHELHREYITYFIVCLNSIWESRMNHQLHMWSSLYVFNSNYSNASPSSCATVESRTSSRINHSFHRVTQFNLRKSK